MARLPYVDPAPEPVAEADADPADPVGHYLMLARIKTALAIDSDPPAGIGALSRSREG